MNNMATPSINTIEIIQVSVVVITYMEIIVSLPLIQDFIPHTKNWQSLKGKDLLNIKSVHRVLLQDSATQIICQRQRSKLVIWKDIISVSINVIVSMHHFLLKTTNTTHFQSYGIEEPACVSHMKKVISFSTIQSQKFICCQDLLLAMLTKWKVKDIIFDLLKIHQESFVY